MIELKPAESDDDLEAWRSVRAAIMPNERTSSVAELRASSDWDTLYLIAFVDSELAGSGISNRASTGGAFTQPRVLPPFRRRGVGTKILHALADQALACGHEEAGSQLEEPGSVAFAARFGFTERNRQIEQVYAVRGDEPEPELPDGIAIVPLRARADLRARMYSELVEAALLDFAVDRPIAITEVYTWTQTGNEAMQQLNRSLGYVDRDVIVSVRASLPLAG